MGTFYKYTSFERGRYILRNKCLPLGHISNYNDPYECSIDCIDEELMSLNRHMSDEQKKEWIKHIITKLQPSHPVAVPSRPSCQLPIRRQACCLAA